MAEKISSFRELKAYQASRSLAHELFEESKAWPKEEVYSLTSQVRRSSRAVGAALAEAWAKRSYPAHFLSKLTDADAELQEVCHWIETASECGYFTESRGGGIGQNRKGNRQDDWYDDAEAREFLLEEGQLKPDAESRKADVRRRPTIKFLTYPSSGIRIPVSILNPKCK